MEISSNETLVYQRREKKPQGGEGEGRAQKDSAEAKFDRLLEGQDRLVDTMDLLTSTIRRFADMKVNHGEGSSSGAYTSKKSYKSTFSPFLPREEAMPEVEARLPTEQNIAAKFEEYRTLPEEIHDAITLAEYMGLNKGRSRPEPKHVTPPREFVEAVLLIKANTQYPMVPPELELIDSKGLDDKRYSDLLSEIQHEAKMLASSPMLVALCEAAIDRLSKMNHPEGNCSFCLFPLLMEDAQSGSRPFMKLMSCFHCFHSDCFGRWWRWLQEQNRLEKCNSADTTLSRLGDNADEIYSGLPYSSEVNKCEEYCLVNCPVCRKVIHAEDVDHVRQFLTSDLDTRENDEGSRVDNILSTEEENKRRETFAQMFKVQKECGGIIEPKKLVILPGMFLPGLGLASIESVDGSNEETVPVHEVNLGQGSVEAAASSSDLPSSSTNPTSDVETQEAGNHTTAKHLDVNFRGLNFGKRRKKNFRRHDNQQSSHKQKEPSRKQTCALPAKSVWVKKE